MTVSMYQMCIPSAVRMLNNVSALIDKAIAFCEAKKIDQSVIMQTRLAADMLPFPRQIHIMTDQVKGLGARLAGIEVPVYADDEKTLEELKARIAKTVAFLNTLKPAQIDGTEEKDITLKLGGNDMSFKGFPYATYLVLPNMYFHATTAYNILRHLGVEIGKRDYLGSP